MTNETDTFVQEVDEKLREDRMLSMAKQYGPWLIGAFAVFILGIGGWQWWRAHTINEARDQADLFSAAQERAAEAFAAQEAGRQADFSEAKQAFESIANQGPRAYRAMARMERAGILVAEGDLEAALAAFDEAAAAAADPVLRESALMRAAYIAAEVHDFDSLQRRLEPLIASEGRVSFLARELLAIEAWESGRATLARDTLEALTLAFDAPEGVRQRAEIALSVIGPAAEAAQEPAPSAGVTE